MNINLSNEMIQTLIDACTTACVEYEGRLPYLKSRALAVLGKDTDIERVRLQNVALLEEQIEETNEALAMLREMVVSQKRRIS